MHKCGIFTCCSSIFFGDHIKVNATDGYKLLSNKKDKLFVWVYVCPNFDFLELFIFSLSFDCQKFKCETKCNLVLALYKGQSFG